MAMEELFSVVHWGEPKDRDVKLDEVTIVAHKYSVQ